MHISEGILPAWSLGAGVFLSLPGLTIGMRRLTPQKMPETALFTACFFVASLIHVPIGPTSAHLLLNGLLGIILGWRVFPAIFIALVLQAILFQYGGLTTLGVNTFSMAFPALVCYLLVHRHISPGQGMKSSVLGGMASGATVLTSGLFTALFLSTAGDEFLLSAKLLLSAHIPVAIIEALITGTIIKGLLRIKPEVLTHDT